MTVNELMHKVNLRILSGEGGLKKIVTGVYCCDLLSWVMSHAHKDNAWITVQTHQNIVAVASLLEISCIILPENIEIESNTKQKADQENIPILQSTESSYKLCCKIYNSGI